jgi:hypothetical protein
MLDDQLKRIKNRIKPIIPLEVKKSIRRIRSFGRTKIFGIGRNKTGTASLRAAMRELGFIVAPVRPGELLARKWAKRDFKALIKFCKTAQFFKDVPFSKPYTFVVLDHEFPRSKFILTVRDSPEQWYNSLTKFHAKLWGLHNRIPTKEDLKKALYIYKGRAWEMNRIIYTTPESEPYKKDVLIKHYIDYNNSVKEYFRHRPDDLLVLNVAEEDAYQKLCNFLNIRSDRQKFPWKNKTEEIKQ